MCHKLGWRCVEGKWSAVCTSGCRTQDHKSWGECMRAKGVTTSGLESTGNDRTAQKKWDKELDRYREARSAGLQPKSTKTKDSIAALESNG